MFRPPVAQLFYKVVFDGYLFTTYFVLAFVVLTT
jgi:hypothetical protein